MTRGSRRSRQQSRTSTAWAILSLMMVAALIIGLVATLTPTPSQPVETTPPDAQQNTPVVITVAPQPTQSANTTTTPTAAATAPSIPLPPTQPAP
jgi:hypothetical protein